MFSYKNPRRIQSKLGQFLHITLFKWFLPNWNVHQIFDIMGVLYDNKNLRSNVLTHIKQEWRYYTRISSTYLAWKKLSFINWFVGITTVSIPADELLVFTCGIFLNIHITVDYTTGQWSTLNVPNITHNLAVGLSDIHLAYLGNCKFSLLCKNTELHTKARKLFNRVKHHRDISYMKRNYTSR